MQIGQSAKKWLAYVFFDNPKSLKTSSKIHNLGNIDYDLKNLLYTEVVDLDDIRLQEMFVRPRWPDLEHAPINQHVYCMWRCISEKVWWKNISVVISDLFSKFDNFLNYGWITTNFIIKPTSLYTPLILNEKMWIWSS